MVLLDFVLLMSFYIRQFQKDELPHIKQIACMWDLLDQLSNEDMHSLTENHEKQQRTSVNEYKVSGYDDDETMRLKKKTKVKFHWQLYESWFVVCP